MSKIVLGTRGSDLALAQADLVTEALNEAYPSLEVEREIVQTVGDRRPDLKLSEFSEGGHGEEPLLDKGIFTRELEIALEEGRIDLAVHSLKDVPTVLDAPFAIVGVLERAPIEDVLVVRGAWDGGGVEALPEGARIATSSVRRAEQLRWMRPDLVVEEIRGNVPTRILKTAEPSGPDFTMLANAGLQRLGLWDGSIHSSFYVQDEAEQNDPIEVSFDLLDPKVFLPAAGQGAVGIEVRAEDAGTSALVRSINHDETWARVRAEREFLHLLEAGCQTPVGVHTEVSGDRMHMMVRVFSESGGEPRESEAEGASSEPEALAQEIFSKVGRA